MSLFTRNHTRAIQSFLLKVVNNNCTELKALAEGPRLEQRLNLTIAVLIVPLADGRPQVNETFTAVTKEFSSTGISLVLDGALGLDDVIVGFSWEHEMSFLRGTAKHLSPIGGGFYQLGVQFDRTVEVDEFPELELLQL